MALTKCKECGAQLSTKAKTCPSCGAKPRRTHWFTWLVAGVICGSALLAALSPSPPPAPSKPPPTPAELAAREKADKAFQARLLMARALAAVLKQSARDPDSLVIESMSANDDGTVVCSEYRARNGFGGMNRGYAMALNGKVTLDNAGLWNKHCTKPLFSVLNHL